MLSSLTVMVLSLRGKMSSSGELQSALAAGSDLIVETDPIVLVENYFTTSYKGKIIGRVKATFDFSELPVELHEQALRLLLSNGTNLCMSTEHMAEIGALRLQQKDDR